MNTEITTLNEIEKSRLKIDLKFSIILISKVYALIAGSIILLFGILYVFNRENLAEGYLYRLAYILGCFLIFSLIALLFNIPILLDLKFGKKIKIVTSDYYLKDTKKFKWLHIGHPKRKFLIVNEVFNSIDRNTPIKIEFTSYSKTLLFISNNDNNLL